MAIVVAIVAIAVFGAVTVMLLARGSSTLTTGKLSRETRHRETPVAEHAGERRASVELEQSGRRRADDTRTELLRRREVSSYEPVGEEELGVTRRQFLNRGLISAVGFGVAAFAPAMLAFLWPLAATDFGGVFTIGSLTDVLSQIDRQGKPFYAPQARTYIVGYPKQNPNAVAAAKQVYKPPIYAGMAQYGIVALYQRCPHLGCRVPFCESSQWFECPCHGSKYNRVGEKKAGPAPRGMDRFHVTVESDVLKVDTGTIYVGPPIGTNTTGQEAEGPLCV